MKNWKTTLSGICTVLPMVLHAIFPTVVTMEVAGSLSALFVGLGLAAAKDHNVSGTGKNEAK